MIDDMAELRSFPMPPSDNALKVPLIIGGRSRTVKSADYREYEYEVKTWAIRNQESLSKARDLTLKLQPGWALKLELIYWFQRTTVIQKSDSKKTGTKAGDPKRHDVTNRIKALNDALFAILGCDDKYVWQCNVIKKVLSHVAFPECVDITLSLVDMEAK